MGEFDLDLQSAEGEMELPEGDSVVLGILDGSTPGEEWLATVEAGNTLVLDVEGELAELAADFAPRIKELGGTLVRFRGFLVVTPPDIEVDTERL
ncbi:DUF5779 family protein [Halosegnis sp.]|uniref:DUF5779 family protein n=1 Tax=Halosegnis sp. TaxID=2864959 RepID=UPI0035D5238A